jgi:hypothetical protein
LADHLIFKHAKDFYNWDNQEKSAVPVLIQQLSSNPKWYVKRGLLQKKKVEPEEESKFAPHITAKQAWPSVAHILDFPVMRL